MRKINFSLPQPIRVKNSAVVAPRVVLSSSDSLIMRVERERSLLQTFSQGDSPLRGSPGPSHYSIFDNKPSLPRTRNHDHNRLFMI